ncbi:hypothetical protein L2E82_47825 [Cichorium intybus]|uniref:Uncharacterized protein n=1 Tax=Cichorium intybus TaxID=13427 RepID=A0ACB8YWM0_CICIN|nr:hypothetical protein L2E82_47825 [Cichorium intybus]
MSQFSITDALIHYTVIGEDDLELKQQLELHTDPRCRSDSGLRKVSLESRRPQRVSGVTVTVHSGSVKAVDLILLNVLALIVASQRRSGAPVAVRSNFVEEVVLSLLNARSMFRPQQVSGVSMLNSATMVVRIGFVEAVILSLLNV